MSKLGSSRIFPAPRREAFSHSAVGTCATFAFIYPIKMDLIWYPKLQRWAEAEMSDYVVIFMMLQKVKTQSGKLLERVVIDVG